MQLSEQKKEQMTSQVNLNLLKKSQGGNQQDCYYQNINKIADSTLKFKTLIQSLRKKKYENSLQSNTQNNLNNKYLPKQSVPNENDDQKSQYYKQETKKDFEKECKNEESLQSKRSKKQKIGSAFIMSQQKSLPITKAPFIVNPELIDKNFLKDYCKSIKQNYKNQAIKEEVKYPTISLTQSFFSKISKAGPQQNKLNQRISMAKKIKDIEQNSIKQYFKSCIPLSSDSKPQEIFDLFSNILKLNSIQLNNPFIKKYKNCIFYGRQHEENQKYQGFLYYYQGKIYYGQFLNQQKHGHGVQIDLQHKKLYKGQFVGGRKTGKFLFKSQQAEYIGYMQNGLYQGEGKLKTNQSTYEGFFELGLKHGYGQEYFTKTGLCIKGVYQKNQFQKAEIRKIKMSSQPQFRKNQKVKQKSKQRVLNSKLKIKLQCIINPQSQFSQEKQKKFIGSSNLKFLPNYLQTNRKETDKHYFSERNNKSKKQESEQLDIQKIYLEKQKFRKNSKSFRENRERNNRQKRQKDSLLSLLRLNSHEQQIPLAPYFHVANF